MTCRYTNWEIHPHCLGLCLTSYIRDCKYHLSWCCRNRWLGFTSNFEGNCWCSPCKFSTCDLYTILIVGSIKLRHHCLHCWQFWRIRELAHWWIRGIVTLSFLRSSLEHNYCRFCRVLLLLVVRCVDSACYLPSWYCFYEAILTSKCAIETDLYWVISFLLAIVCTSDCQQCTTINGSNLGADICGCGADIQNLIFGINKAIILMPNGNLELSRIATTPPFGFGSSKLGDQLLRLIIYVNDIHISNVSWIGGIGSIHSEMIFIQCEREVCIQCDCYILLQYWRNWLWVKHAAFLYVILHRRINGMCHCLSIYLNTEFVCLWQAQGFIEWRRQANQCSRHCGLDLAGRCLGVVKLQFESTSFNLMWEIGTSQGDVVASEQIQVIEWMHFTDGTENCLIGQSRFVWD